VAPGGSAGPSRASWSVPEPAGPAPASQDLTVEPHEPAQRAELAPGREIPSRTTTYAQTGRWGERVASQVHQDQTPAVEPVKLDPVAEPDPAAELARRALARVDLERLRQHRAQPGLAQFMLPLGTLHVPATSSPVKCGGCGRAISTDEQRRQHVVERFDQDRPRCVAWGLGLP